MPKTTFAAMMQIPSAWLNKVFGPTGHRHDGLDEDGHAPLDYAVDSGVANGYEAVLTPALTAHIAGLPLFVNIAATNTHVPKSVTALTRAGGTATATVPAHGCSIGDFIVVSGAVQTAYNGVFQIAAVTADTYDYPVANMPATPATGSILATKAATFHPSGLAATPIVKAGNAPLIPGDIASGHIAVFQYNGEAYELQNPAYAESKYAEDYGVADNYSINVTPAPGALTKGMKFYVYIKNANVSATPQITVNGFGPYNIQKQNGATLNPGDMLANHISVLVFSGAAFDLLNPYILPELGAWDNVSFALNTVYQAATGGFVDFSTLGSGGSVSCTGYTDSSNPPATIGGAAYADINNNCGFTMPVRKGDYWKVTAGGPHASDLIRWIPLTTK
ncbi:hypothetical protein EPN18_06800 [bacterium]|nr:MAG: hypothetical protein EPN18_06800 [bacterium]